jgi:hypothetical protein
MWSCNFDFTHSENIFNWMWLAEWAPTTVHSCRWYGVLGHLETAGQLYTHWKLFILLAVLSVVSATVDIIERGTSYSLYHLGPSLPCQLLASNLITAVSSWINICCFLYVEVFVLWANSQLFVEQNVVLVLIIVTFVFPQVLHLLIYK